MSDNNERLYDINLKNLSIPEMKIDLNDQSSLNDKVLNERETRKRLLKHARLVGCEFEMLKLFGKADKLMRNCSNEQERLDIGKVFVKDVYFLLGGGGELYVNGQLVYKDKK